MTGIEDAAGSLTARRAEGLGVTIRREGEGFRVRASAGSGVPPDTAAAQVGASRAAFSDGGKRFFSDVGFPARRGEILASAIAHGAPADILAAIRGLEDSVFEEADDLPDLYARAGYGLPSGDRPDGNPRAPGPRGVLHGARSAESPEP